MVQRGKKQGERRENGGLPAVLRSWAWARVTQAYKARIYGTELWWLLKASSFPIQRHTPDMEQSGTISRPRRWKKREKSLSCAPVTQLDLMVSVSIHTLYLLQWPTDLSTEWFTWQNTSSTLSLSLCLITETEDNVQNSPSLCVNSLGEKERVLPQAPESVLTDRDRENKRQSIILS